MLGSKQTTKQTATPYATGADFCRIFQKDMNRLYLLSFLLTGEASMAEKCFARGLEDSAKGNPVFKEWANSWARRTIIQNAIQLIRPRPVDRNSSNSAAVGGAGRTLTGQAEIAAIVALPTFERFAFVMSVLERYSDQECSLLLDCARGDVMLARTRALEKTADSAGLSRRILSTRSEEATDQDRVRPAPQLEAISPLLASA